MKIYRLKIKVNGKNNIVAVRGPNMIQLVAACERNGLDYTVKYIGKI